MLFWAVKAIAKAYDADPEISVIAGRTLSLLAEMEEANALLAARAMFRGALHVLSRT